MTAEERGIRVAQCEFCGTIFDVNSEEAQAGWHEVVVRDSAGDPEPMQCGPISERTLYKWETVLAAQREAEVGMRERCRIVARDHECDKRCKDEGLGPMCQFTIMEDIAILASEYGEVSDAG